MADDVGIYSVEVAQQIYDATFGGKESEFKEHRRPSGGKGGDAILFVTRTGGIAARTTTTLPHTFPSATVDLLDPVTGNVYSPNRTQTVYNMTNIVVAHVANRPRQAKKIGIRYFIDVDDC